MTSSELVSASGMTSASCCVVAAGGAAGATLADVVPTEPANNASATASTVAIPDATSAPLALIGVAMIYPPWVVVVHACERTLAGLLRQGGR